MTDQVSGGMDASLLKGAVVVGDDGSADSADAVLWAAEDAARRETRLVVVRAWSITTAPRPEGVEPGYIPSEDEFAEAVRKALATDVEPVLRRSAVKPEVVLMPAHCSAETALIDATAHAAVTVVGTRGRGLARWLGSVSTALVRSAHGPVVVVPRSSRGETG